MHITHIHHIPRAYISCTHTPTTHAVFIAHEPDCTWGLFLCLFCRKRFCGRFECVHICLASGSSVFATPILSVYSLCLFVFSRYVFLRVCFLSLPLSLSLMVLPSSFVSLFLSIQPVISVTHLRPTAIVPKINDIVTGQVGVALSYYLNKVLSRN